MIIVYKAWAGGGNQRLTVKEAIDASLTPFAYSYEGGQLERLQAEVDKLKEVLLKLVVHLGEDNKKLVEAVIECGMEVEE